MFQLLLAACLFVQAGPNPNLATTSPQDVDTRTGVNPATFEAIYREAKAVEAATVTGVNYAKYRALIQSFAKEAAILSDQPLSRDERAVLVLFKAALNAHMDSATIWRRKLAMPYDQDNIFQGGIFYSGDGTTDPSLEPLVKRYQIQIRDIRLPSTKGVFKIIPADSVKIPWMAAGKALSEAVSLYMPSVPEQKKLDATDEEAIRTLERLAKPKP